MGLLLNGKRSTLAPHRANWLSFIHDNYDTYFDIDLWSTQLINTYKYSSKALQQRSTAEE